MNNKWKKKYHTVSTGSISNGKIVETEEKSTPLTHIHDHSISWLVEIMIYMCTCILAH
jgi:hypothetical protein